jgi:beta-lactamase regulating signal transducer with metallopeptidase domain
LLDHDDAERCFEPGFFAAALVVAVLVLSIRTVRQHRGVRAASADAASALEKRLDWIVARFPTLADLRERLVVTDAEGFAVGTHGLIKPRVFVGTRFAGRVSDEMLASALGHEREHVRAYDPLRYLLLHLALGVNPFGRLLLGPHAARWQAAREAHCDREAVLGGAAPLPLADAIVRAARPSSREAVALGARDTAVLKFRIGMLLAFAEKPPSRCCRQGVAAFPLAFILLLVAVLLPHQTGTHALDAVHTGAEHALNYFWP